MNHESQILAKAYL